jgi:hypothetical protein
MATVTIKLKQPINTSLQAKDSSYDAHDIIYFVKMENGKATGEIKRLGECIKITKDNEYFNIQVNVAVISAIEGVELPTDNDYIFFGKENQIGSSGVKGYFAEVEMQNDSKQEIELFAVGSNIIESSK